VQASGTLIAAVDGLQILPFAGQAHVRCLGNHKLESTNR
jgi:hypothetical protein